MSRIRVTAVAGTIAVLALAVGGCGARGGAAGGAASGDQKFVAKLSHVTTATTPKGKAAVKFKELLEQKSGGRVTVQVFHNSELYGDKDELQAMQSNSVQFLAPASAKFTTVAPALQVLDLPFLFDKVEDIPTVAAPETKVGQAIFNNQNLAERNMKVLGLWDAGLKELTSNKEMKKPADLAGLKMRIQPSDVLKVQFETWGANPTPLAFSEVYNALQQGLINGQENPYSNIESQKMHTVQKFITESQHGYLGYVLVVNKPWYDALPDDLKKAVDDSAKEASEYNRQVAAQLQEESKAKIVAAGTSTITTLTPEERKAFKDAVVPSVWDKFRGVIGEDIIDELLKAQQQ